MAFENELKYLALTELKARKTLAEILPSGCSPRCVLIAHHVGNNFGKRIAQPGNKHYPPGTVHEQCKTCREREKNELELAMLKHQIFDA